MEKGEIRINTENIFPIIKKAVYSDHEIFLRELVSNGVDAISKRRMASMAGDCENTDEAQVKISIDRENNTLTISDNGIGMNEEEIIENIGTIAKSGTAQFLSEMTGDKSKDSNLIGQFGVGFYSVFMVADKVSVHSRSALNKSEDAIMWESTGEDTYQLSKIPKAVSYTHLTLPTKA